MDRVKKYDEYCILASTLDAKNDEVGNLKRQLDKAEYEQETLRKKMRKYADMKQLSVEDIASIRNSRIRTCLSQPFLFESGGGISGSPIKAFESDKKDGLGGFTKEQKDLYKKIKPALEYNQYGIQNALSIAEVEDEDFDVNDSVVIDDFIDEFIDNINEGDKYTVPQLKETKKIMYIFVEHIQKFN